jgi:2-dehydro-3-deoxyphosphooctonate aldolase (KDO 8-P synthase)
VPNNVAQVGPYSIGTGHKLLVIAGPCVIETEELTLSIARRLKEIAEQLPIQLVF